MRITDLVTPALLVDGPALTHNLDVMGAAWPGTSLRPHVKAFKSTGLARELAARGHTAFCGATVRELEGLAAAGLGEDLLLANEMLDARRLGRLVRDGARVTVAVDSEETIDAAAAGGVPEVLVDVDVGLPRCGCPPEEAGRLAALARRRGLAVRGVMGYEGHVVGLEDRTARAEGTEAAMALLTRAHGEVGGEVVSGGGTGTWDLNRWVTELQAGSFVVMDTAYARLDLPFRQALSVLGTVISVNRAKGFAVADVGLKALGMDHGNPSVDGMVVWFCSDEHVTFAPAEGSALPAVGERIRVRPAHVDPTIAYHEHLHVVDGDEVVETWAVDLRGWGPAVVRPAS
jgi:D-serine deaminase-like pyridoxal phosphate-dependent protein